MENASKYSVIVSDRASQMLVSHAWFLANVSEESAQKLISEFTASVKALETAPERNAWLSDPALPINKYRKLLFYKRYLMIYQPCRKTPCFSYGDIRHFALASPVRGAKSKQKGFFFADCR